MLGERGERDARAACAAVRCEVGIPTKRRPCCDAGQRFDREVCRRAGTQADHHAVLDQRDRGLGRRALERIAIAPGPPRS